jgi:hypothetical protein
MGIKLIPYSVLCINKAFKFQRNFCHSNSDENESKTKTGHAWMMNTWNSYIFR